MSTFDEIQFPYQISYGSKGGPTFSTDVIVLASSYEERQQNWSMTRHKFNISTGLKSDADAQQLLAFFLARAGRARAFRYKDWADYTALAGSNLGAGVYQVCAAIDATHFQLQKTYTYVGDGTGVTDPQSYVRIIQKPCNYGTWEVPVAHPDGTAAIPVTMYVSGSRVASSTFTVDYTTGIVTFGSGPGSTPTANFEFDVPCRFDTDDAEITLENYSTNIWTSVPIIEVRL